MDPEKLAVIARLFSALTSAELSFVIAFAQSQLDAQKPQKIAPQTKTEVWTSQPTTIVEDVKPVVTAPKVPKGPAKPSMVSEVSKVIKKIAGNSQTNSAPSVPAPTAPKKIGTWADQVQKTTPVQKTVPVEVPLKEIIQQEKEVRSNASELTDFCEKPGCGCVYVFRGEGDKVRLNSKLLEKEQLYIGGLSRDISHSVLSEQLRSCCEANRKPVKIYVEEGKGFGFLTFKTHADASKAFKIFAGKPKTLGSDLTVNFVGRNR